MKNEREEKSNVIEWWPRIKENWIFERNPKLIITAMVYRKVGNEWSRKESNFWTWRPTN